MAVIMNGLQKEEQNTGMSGKNMSGSPEEEQMMFKVSCR